MDLRSIINNEAADNASKQAAPATPVQATIQQTFRDFNHPSHAPPAKHPSQDYGSQQPGGPYASPKTYQANYPGRPPPPPPIQAPPQSDLRSPARSFSAQSPYRTPSSTVSNAQYPFPHTNQTPQSPAQHHQYPPSFQQRERESYPQSNPPPHLQHQNSNQQASPTPQTPPIGIPGAPHPYLQHQRSHSSISTSTPTSAQSQAQYYPQYPQDSPVSAAHLQHNQIPQHNRHQSLQSQQSQPGTPLGPPLNQRQASGGYNQPTSPYQQRGQSAGPFSQYQQSSPAPAAATIPRLPSTPSAYDSQRTSISDQQRRSQSERERSLSVSPKTRLPSGPPGQMSPSQPEPVFNSTKRKMEDRDIPIEQPRRVDQVDANLQVNGSHRTPSATTSSPTQPPKKRIRYTEPPIWAQSIRNKNFAGKAQNLARPNGRPALASSPVVKNATNGNRHASPIISRDAPSDSIDPHPSLLLGPWEQSITSVKPSEALSSQVADFIFANVVSRSDLGELASRGVHIEIEAKLGQLINIENNERLNLPVTTECIISEHYRLVGFRSAMTEHQHQVLNAMLNSQVADAHPNNPSRTKRRVEIGYVHSRENDKFFELPPKVVEDLLPATIRQHQNRRHGTRLRVTYDQKTNQIRAKIIKVRVADLNILMPRQPLDCRISINFEIDVKGDVEDLIAMSTGIQQPARSKDRLSYTQGLYQLDLTQVTTTKSHNGSNIIEKEHEMEIEVSTAAIREQGTRAKSGQPNEYLALVEGMVDNIRVISRAVPAE